MPLSLKLAPVNRCFYADQGTFVDYSFQYGNCWDVDTLTSRGYLITGC